METEVTKDKLQKLQTASGENVWDLLNHGKVILLFLRIFGCPYCRKAIYDVNEIVKPLKQMKMSVVFVHQGPEEMARDVFEQYGSNLKRMKDVADSEDAGPSNKFPFYEVVDAEREYYRLFNLPEFNMRNFQRKEQKTWNRCTQLYGSDELLGDILQLGGLFVINQDGSVFSSLRQHGQTNLHELAEFIHIPMDVRFSSDHTKQVYYRLGEEYDDDGHETAEDGTKNTSHVSSPQRRESDTTEMIEEHDHSKRRQQHHQPVPVQEKYKEYSNLELQPVSKQKIYKRQSKNENENEKEDINNNSNNNDNDQSIELKHPMPIKSTSGILKVLRCLPSDLERPYTEQQLRDVVQSWTLEAVLNDKALRKFFRVFLTKEVSLENILFYESVEDIMNQIQNNNNNNNKNKNKNNKNNEKKKDIKSEHQENENENDDDENNSSKITPSPFHEKLANLINGLIDEYMKGDSINMVNLSSNHVQNLTPFKDPQNVAEQLDDLQNYLSNAKDAIHNNMMDPLQRFRWSIEGERAAAFTIVHGEQ